MFIIENIRQKITEAGDRQATAQEEVWWNSEYGPIGLFISVGRRGLGIEGADFEAETDLKALQYMAQRHILPSEDLEPERVALLQDMFARGTLAINNHQGLKPLSLEHNMSRQECLTVLEEAFGLVRDGYREQLTSHIDDLVKQSK